MTKISNTEKKQFAFTTGVIALFISTALLSLLFVKLALEVREGDTKTFDESVLRGINSLSSPVLDQFIPLLTELGGIIIVGLSTLILLALFVYKKEYYRTTHVALSMAGAAVLNVVMKSIFERTRPDLWEKLVHESSYSFPSGHSMMSAAFGVMLIAVLWNSRWRWWAVWASVLYIPFIGFTRMYLGVHYPTDIIAGWMIAAAWVMAITLLLRSNIAHHALKKFER